MSIHFQTNTPENVPPPQIMGIFSQNKGTIHLDNHLEMLCKMFIVLIVKFNGGKVA